MKRGQKNSSIFRNSKQFPLPDPNKDRQAPIQSIQEYNGAAVWMNVKTGWDNGRALEGVIPEDDAIENYLREYLPEYVVTHRCYGDNHGRGYALLWKGPIIHKHLGKNGTEVCGIKIFSIRGSNASPYVQLGVHAPGHDPQFLIFNYVECKTVDYGWPSSYTPRENDDLVQLVRETLKGDSPRKRKAPKKQK